MPPRKRRPGRAEEYRSPGDPYEGGSPGVECFIEWLLEHWLDRTTEEAVASWRRSVADDPNRVDIQLDCIKRIVDEPPVDLVSVMKQYGSINLYHSKRSPWTPFSRQEYVDWLKGMVQRFVEIAEDR